MLNYVKFKIQFIYRLIGLVELFSYFFFLLATFPDYNEEMVYKSHTFLLKYVKFLLLNFLLKLVIYS